MPTRKPVLRPTMTDIARLAGVSQSCVSLVLNDAPGGRLSEATKQRVKETARQLGYILPPRRVATPAASDTPHCPVLAYVVDEVSISPHPVLNIDGARDAAWSQECLLQVHVTRGDAGLEAASLATIRGDPTIIGVIYASSFTRQVELPAGMDGMKLVMLNCYMQRRIHPTLLPGEVAGGFAATQHLLDLGHRRIGMIGGEPWMDAARDRLKGYREALTTADIAFDPALLRHGDWSAGSGFQHALTLMQQPRPPTALFCANDMMALGAIDALASLGLTVPLDMSVVGYNDLELVRHMRPPLASCRVPSYDLGYRAAEMLLAHASSGRSLRPLLTKLECQLIPRASTAAPRVAVRRLA